MCVHVYICACKYISTLAFMYIDKIPKSVVSVNTSAPHYPAYKLCLIDHTCFVLLIRFCIMQSVSINRNPE